MKLDPISPQSVTSSSRYVEQKRTPFERFLDKIKPRSSAMRTTILVSFVVMFSLLMSLWLFWRTLYLPEIQQHARYLSIELELLQNKDLRVVNHKNQQDIDTQAWLEQQLGVKYVTDPAQYPQIREKIIADFFTNRIEQALARELNTTEEVTVYFQFKPTPRIWVQTPTMNGHWLYEPLHAYANYSLELLLAWLLGVPILTMLIVLILVRQQNRPLRRLQDTANLYSRTGAAPYLQTTHGPVEIRQVNIAFNHLMSNLEQTEKDRQIMLAGISHDLRTPLTRIRITAEMLPDEFLKEGLIYDVDDMDAILEQFISYMRDGSDEELKPTNINTLLQELVIQFKPLQMTFTAQPLPLLMMRSLSFKRLIANLINNAKRYGAEPIDLAAYVEQQHLIVKVSDHGEGIPEDQIEALMQPFVRGNAARTIQGSGLGLAIVKRIVDIHHGQIKIQNRAEGGLEVMILLPIELLKANDADETA
ncbi:MAG: ATP-binding protein [Acinetobacter sp.]|nr:ATP-binding protein [Acinetobacter sp.]